MGREAAGRQAHVHRGSTASPVQTGMVPADPAPLPSPQPGAGTMFEVWGGAGGLGDVLHPVLNDIYEGREVLGPGSSQMNGCHTGCPTEAPAEVTARLCL